MSLLCWDAFFSNVLEAIQIDITSGTIFMSRYWINKKCVFHFKHHIAEVVLLEFFIFFYFTTFLP